jgi:hypothetical protein
MEQARQGELAVQGTDGKENGRWDKREREGGKRNECYLQKEEV